MIDRIKRWLVEHPGIFRGPILWMMQREIEKTRRRYSAAIEQNIALRKQLERYR